MAEPNERVDDIKVEEVVPSGLTSATLMDETLSAVSDAASTSTTVSTNEVKKPTAKAKLKKLRKPKEGGPDNKYERKKSVSKDSSPKDKVVRSAGAEGKQKQPRMPGLFRRNIKDLFKEDDLDATTLQAQQAEFERMQRRQEELTSVDIPSCSSPGFNLDLILKEEKDTEEENLDEIVEQEEFESVLRETSPDADVITLTSDSEDEKKPFQASAPSKACTTLEKSTEIKAPAPEDNDDIICLGSGDEGADAPDEKPAPGSQEVQQLHCDDRLNVPDQDGRMLVNVRHPPEDEDIFLAQHLVQYIKAHQLGGIRFMFDNIVESVKDYQKASGGCILAHSMGLGKTLQVVAFVDSIFRQTPLRRMLIIVPINTLQNWVHEFERWLPKLACPEADIPARAFEVFVLGDNLKTLKQRAETIGAWHRSTGVLLLGYDIFRLLTNDKTSLGAAPPKRRRVECGSSATGCASMSRNLSSCALQSDDSNSNSTCASAPASVFPAENSHSVNSSSNKEEIKANEIKAMAEQVRNWLLDPGPDVVICDEGHKIKNLAANISKALNSIRTKRRIVLTGYPLQNNLIEYYCMVNFIRPNFLGSKKQFANMFERPIANGQCVDSTAQDIRLMKQRTHVLTKLVAGFVQRRTHSILHHMLPEKREFVLFIRKSPVQQWLYKRFMVYCRTEMEDDNMNLNPLKAFAVCCKIWNHPDILYKFVRSKGALRDLDLDLPDQPSSFLIDGVEPPLSAAGETTKNGGRKRKYNSKKSPAHDGLNQATLGRYGFASSTPGESPVDTNNSLISFDSPLSFDVLAPSSKSFDVLASNSNSFDMPPTNSNSIDVPTPGVPGATGTGFCPFKSKKEIGAISYAWSEDILSNYVSGNLNNGFKFVIAFSLIDLSIMRGDKVLVFSQSLLTLDLLEEFLRCRIVPGSTEAWKKNRNYFRLDGSTNASERERLINRFNCERSVHLFLISTRAGSLGINLTSASRVLVLDASWNPCHDAQAVCRVYRYGQQKPCFVYRLVTDNSMERAIFNRQVGKQGISDRIIDQRQVETSLSAVELYNLMQYDEGQDVLDVSRECSFEGVPDEVLLTTCRSLKDCLAKEPVPHESLLLDRSELQELTKQEKNEAMRQYRREIRALNGEVLSNSSYLMAPAYQAGLAALKDHPGAGPRFQRYPFGPMGGGGPTLMRPLQPTPVPMGLRRVTAFQGPMGLVSDAARANLRGPRPLRHILPAPAAYGPRGPGQGANNPQLNPRFYDVRHIVVSRGINLPLVNNPGSHFLSEGERVTLVRTHRGLYVRTLDGIVLNATGSVFDVPMNHIGPRPPGDHSISRPRHPGHVTLPRGENLQPIAPRLRTSVPLLRRPSGLTGISARPQQFPGRGFNRPRPLFTEQLGQPIRLEENISGQPINNEQSSVGGVLSMPSSNNVVERPLLSADDVNNADIDMNMSTAMPMSSRSEVENNAFFSEMPMQSRAPVVTTNGSSSSVSWNNHGEFSFADIAQQNNMNPPQQQIIHDPYAYNNSATQQQMGSIIGNPAPQPQEQNSYAKISINSGQANEQQQFDLVDFGTNFDYDSNVDQSITTSTDPNVSAFNYRQDEDFFNYQLEFS